MQAVILCAGKGTRLRPLTYKTPKPLIDIAGKPLLERVFEAMPDAINELIVVVGYLHEQIMEHFGDRWQGRKIRWVIQDPLDGTGGGVHRCRRFLHGRFLVVNGDDLYHKNDLTKLCQLDRAILIRQTGISLYASAVVGKNGLFKGLTQGPIKHTQSVRVCGAYVLDERFFDCPLVEIQVNEHREFGLPQTLAKCSKTYQLQALEGTFWIPVGTPGELEIARARFQKEKDG